MNGACRSNELLQITINDIQKHSDNLLLIVLTDTKTKIDRTFVIRQEYVKIVEKYQALRPTNTKTDRFFLQYHGGKCTRQPIGINKIGAMPKEIASFLNLSNPEKYTGHCFRRSSATLLANSGADLIELKRHGGWRSSTVAESYIEDSIENKSKRCSRIVESINLKPSAVEPSAPLSPARPSTSKGCETTTLQLSQQQQPQNTATLPNTQVLSNTTVSNPNQPITLNFKNCSNFTIHF